jgi:hypothetical protein
MALPKIHSSNIVFLTICVVGIVVFFLVGIYPNMRSIAELNAEDTALTQKVASQELLYPIFRQLIKEVQQPIPTKLVLPEESSLSQQELNQINAIFRRSAQHSGTEFLRAVPDASSYLDDADHLSIQVSFKGDFFNLRNLLFDLCALPFLDAIDQMSLESGAGEKIIELKLSLLQK